MYYVEPSVPVFPTAETPGTPVTGNDTITPAVVPESPGLDSILADIEKALEEQAAHAASESQADQSRSELANAGLDAM